MEIGKILDNGRLSLNKRNKGNPYSISISVEGVVSTITEILLTKQNLLKLYKMIKQEIDTEPKEWEMKFGDKVKFTNKVDVHPDLKNKEYCLLGFNDCAFALIKWKDRGKYNFEFYSGDVFEVLELISIEQE